MHFLNIHNNEYQKNWVSYIIPRCHCKEVCLLKKWYIVEMYYSSPHHFVLCLVWNSVFNALVYFRPKYKSDRTNNPTESRTSSVLRVLKISLPTVNCCRAISQQKPNETMEGTYVHRTEENKIEEKKNGDGVGDEEANENSNDIEQKEGDKELEVGSG